MKTLLLLALSGVSAAAAAQTPAANPMPDGSRDMYIGLGASVQPRYEGADGHRTRAVPLLQFEWSNGLFVSGMSAGWHLARSSGVEFGPLVGVHPGRDEAGLDRSAIPVFTTDTASNGVVHGFDRDKAINRLAGQPHIKARLTAGGFFNYYLGPRIRLNNTLLYGAGGNGLVWEASVQNVMSELDSHHRVSLSAGFTAVNRAYNTTFFGLQDGVVRATGLHAYRPDGGVKDVFVGARWNWALAPSWIVSTSARAARLQGDARHSPLVERSSQLSISTGLAHRF